MLVRQHRTLGKLVTGVALLGALGLSSIAPLHTQASSSRDNSTILVWTDATRLPAFQLYQKMHPSVSLKIVTYDATTILAKILLFNRTGGGWPDVVFDSQPADVASLSAPNFHYTASLGGLVSKSVLSKFAQGPLGQCVIGGKLYCLRNDIAQNVLWYNTKLLKQFGYTVPTTWEQYSALGVRVAKEHPGYVIGAAGSSFALYSYYWPSGCPITTLVNPGTVRINLADPSCTRVTKMLDPLIANGSISKSGPFDADFTKVGNQDKILMLPEASWFGQYVYKASYKTPNGETAAALPLRWAADKQIWTGAEGGGAYFVSSHARNPQAAADIITWICTNNAYQATAPTFPAYLPAADVWAATISHDRFYATNPYPVLRQAASMVRPTWGYVRYDAEGTFNTTVLPPMKAGKTLASTMSTYGSQLKQLAQTAGYTVTQ